MGVGVGGGAIIVIGSGVLWLALCLASKAPPYSPTRWVAKAWWVFLFAPVAAATLLPLEISEISILVLSGAITMFLVGAAILPFHASRALRCRRRSNISAWRKVLMAVLILYIVSSGLLIEHWLVVFGLEMSLGSLLSLGHLNAQMRYSGDLQIPFVGTLSAVAGFVAASVAGVVQGVTGAKSKSLLILAIGIVNGLFAGARAATLFMIVFWAAGLLAATAIRDRTPGPYLLKPSFRALGRLTIFGTAIFVFFAGVQLSRGQVDEWSRVPDVVSSLVPWFFGYLPGFSSWFERFYFDGELTLGAFTFAGLFDAAGIRERELGLYPMPLPIGGQWETNIFTAFRGIVSDFGITGLYCLMLFAGVVANRAHRAAAQGGALGVGTLYFIYSFFFWAPIVSILIYNTVLVAIAVTVVLLVTLGAPTAGQDPRSRSPELLHL